MAPQQKGSKRSAASDQGPAASKSRKTGDVELIQNVLRTKALDCPGVVREMLVAMLPGSLGVPSDLRHKHQHAGVVMIEETLASVKSRIAKLISEEDVNVNEVIAQKAALEANVEELQKVLEQRQQAVAAREAKFAGAELLRDEAKKGAADAAKAQRDGDAEIETSKSEREGNEALLSGSWKLIIDGTWDSEKDLKKLVGQVLAVLKQIGLDDSCITALPAACGKKPDARGSFDTMVLQQVEQALTSYSGTLAATIAAAAPAAAEREAALAAAQGNATAAEEEVQTSQASLTAAQSELQEAEDSIAKAKKSTKAFIPAFRSATKSRDALSAEMQELESELAVVMALKARVSAQKQKELAAAEKKAAAEAAAAGSEEQAVEEQQQATEDLC